MQFLTRYQDLATLVKATKTHKTQAGRARWIQTQTESGRVVILETSEAVPAKRKPATASVQDRVVKVEHRAPKVEATMILQELPYAWAVECESAGCGNGILVEKAHWRPVDFSNPDGDTIEVRFSAPGRRTCSGCIVVASPV